ncbi:hypothetical protein [Pseudopedobacter beijingensis]|uniref:Lipoprotein n=1 Tax=Pseudopedobacter beijingensis TaxID=1207056 RepID=A0ABW4IFJ6_9SPHI
MKTIYKILNKLGGSVIAVTLLSGCTLFGLDIQKDYNRTPHTLEPNLNKTVWQYLKDRSSGSTAESMIFSRMMEGIEYAEIDSNEYKKPGRTFILLHNDMIYRSKATEVSFWNSVKVNGQRATKWSDYPKEFVRNYFLYLIVEGVYDHYTLSPLETVRAKTLAPAGYFNSLPPGITMLNFVANTNPESLMYIKMLNSSASNTSDYPIQLNDFFNIRTSSLLATNGTIHVAGYIGANGPYLIPVLPL